MSSRKDAAPLGMVVVAAACVFCAAACDGNRAHDEVVVIDPDVYGKAADFVLPSLTSEQVALADSAGAVRVINFWATWCAPCREEMPSLETLHRRHRKSGRLVVLAISVDEDIRAAREYVNAHGFTFPVLLDQRRVVANRFGVTVFPTSFVVDAEGHVVDRIEGAVDWAEDGLIGLADLRGR